jgi:Dolichyl-phosphate-mannose-protein mannosyltransferase
LKATAKGLLCSLPAIVTVAFVVRVAFLVPAIQQMYRGVVIDFHYGVETGAVAAAIAQGRGFSSPLRLVQTGPTAWFAPIFPYLLAGVFKLFGVYSYTSDMVIRFLDLAFSSFTCWPIAAIATRAFGRKTGIAAAWMWVFLPTAIFYPVMWVWDTSLATLWLAMLVASTLQLHGSDRMSRWLGYGALWSAGAMINPSLLSVLPPLGLWAIWPLRRRMAPALKLASAAALIFAIGIVPWTIRNYEVFHAFVPLRSNFGLELWLGNNPGVPDSSTPWLHPNENIDEAQRYARMTEIPYMEEKQSQAWAFIRSHPADTARFVLHRFTNHWLGIWDSPVDLWPTAPWSTRLRMISQATFALLAWLGLLFAYRARNAAASALGIVMIVFPLVFYLTHTDLRYRHPMEPVMLVLAVFAVVYAASPKARRVANTETWAAGSEPLSEAVAAPEPVTVLR